MKKFIFLFAAIISLFCASFTFAQELQILTVDEPPSSFKDEKGLPTGFAVDVVTEIQKRISNRDKITIMPEARVIKTATESPNALIFAFSRTPAREDKFHWIMHIIRKPWILYSNKGANISLNSLEDAKKIEKIGVVRGDVRDQQLKQLGFTNIEDVTTFDQNIKKMRVNRLQLLYYEPLGMAYVCKELGIPIAEFEPVLKTNVSDVYIMMSKQGTDPETVKKWTEAARQIKEDGAFQKIAEKWSKYIYEQVGIMPEFKDGVLNF